MSIKITPCPNCLKSDKIFFTGIKPDIDGQYKNCYECVGCNTEFATEIGNEIIDEFNS